MAETKKVQVVYLGKTYEVEPKEYDQLVQQVFNRLNSYMKSLIATNTQNQKTVQEYAERAQIRNGLFDAATQAIIVRAGSVKYPNPALAQASMKSCVNLGRAMGSQDLKLLKVALPQAEKAVNAFQADVMRFLNEFTGSAGTVATVLQVTSATCFAVVGALAAPILVTAGAGATTATVVAGGGVSFLSSAANELGSVASGQKVTAMEAAKNIGVDTAIGVLTAGIGAKIPLGFVEKMAKGLAPKLAAKVPGIAASQLEPFIVKFLQGTGEETIKSAIGEAVNVIGKIAKSGKAPTKADFEEAVMKVLATALTAGMLKNLASFQKKWAMTSRDTLEGQVFPDVLKGLMKGKNEVPPVLRAKLWSDVWGKVSEEASKAGMGQVLDAGKGSIEESKMLADAKAALLKNPRIRKMIEAETEKALKKHKVGV